MVKYLIVLGLAFDLQVSMADKNQPSSSDNNPHLKVPWPENSLMQRRMNRLVVQWEKQRDLDAKTKEDEIAKNKNATTSQNKNKKDSK